MTRFAFLCRRITRRTCVGVRPTRCATSAQRSRKDFVVSPRYNSTMCASRAALAPARPARIFSGRSIRATTARNDFSAARTLDAAGGVDAHAPRLSISRNSHLGACPDGFLSRANVVKVSPGCGNPRCSRTRRRHACHSASGASSAGGTRSGLGTRSSLILFARTLSPGPCKDARAGERAAE